MASKYRESNMVKWVGVRPAHNGVQVVQRWAVANAVTDVYTVPANKCLLLNALAWSVELTGAVPRRCYIGLRTAAGVFYWFPFLLYVDQQDMPVSGFNSFPIPLEMSAGDRFTLSSTAADACIDISFHGFLIDA